MIRKGAEYLAGLRGGRIVYVGGRRADDVTAHPGFCNAARSHAAIYGGPADDHEKVLL
jgi:4-hydroxyphenylacetate 3-monooxygenase